MEPLVGETPVSISQNNLLATLEEWGPSYVVSLDVFINNWNAAGWYNLLTVTEGAKHSAVGTRVPTVFMVTDSGESKLQIWTDSSDSAQVWRFLPGEEQKWFTLSVSQYFTEVNNVGTDWQLKLDCSRDVAMWRSRLTGRVSTYWRTHILSSSPM